MSDGIRITTTAAPKPKTPESELGFGLVFTDHMLLMDYREDRGWHDARVVPYAPLALDPATAGLHYGQGLFEALKAFRGRDGAIRLFRPDRHAERFNASARRMCVPPIDPAVLVRSWATLVRVDRDWVPAGLGHALYVRPVVLASEAFLGVRSARAFLYFVILSPVGPYYPGGLVPIRIKVVDTHVRATPGGIGDAKTAANYAGTFYAAEEARRAGFTQVLWLDAVHRRYVEEVGVSNIMLRIGDEVVTPPLAGTILPGVTRDTALTLLRQWPPLRVTERPIAIDEVLEAARAGTLHEVWATGTASVVSPVGELAYRDERIVVDDGKIGDLTRRLYDAITAIQYGTGPDVHRWTVAVA